MVVTKADNISLGDFNYLHIDCVNMHASLEFQDIINDCAPEQMVAEPTRGVEIFALVPSGSQDLVRDTEVATSTGNLY